MDIMTMILTNQLFTYEHRMWQVISSYDDGTVDIINSDDEVESISKEELERILAEVEVA